MVWSGVHDVVGYGFSMMWCGVVRYDVLWCAMVWGGVVRCGEVRYGVNGVVCCGVI